MQPWQAHVLTAFPQMFPGALGFSNVGKALNENIWSLDTHDLRQYATTRYASIDDTPFGGGAGMVICPQIIAGIMDKVLSHSVRATLPRLFLSPRGKPFSVERAKALATGDGAVLLCGRYEGVDQRALEYYNFEEISIGDYVISSGELASSVLLDATVRLLPRVLGALASLTEESFEHNLLEYPHYTRPAVWRGLAAPEVLLSGHHRRIAQWRLQQSCALTAKVRPDLFAKYQASHSKLGEDN
ncbi:MAG: tRNA (guanosine(37)-N1)-methyltransferase TrmD [Alphaproteobacteria bacterium]|nr:tRNA (guanosine(37)-N1)-methyltransferase TrmD [Alphaproteobacteria bacterium]